MLRRIISAILVAVMLSGSLAVNISAAEYTQNDTVLNVEQLAEELTETVSEMEHPYILYTEKDIPKPKPYGCGCAKGIKKSPRRGSANGLADDYFFLNRLPRPPSSSGTSSKPRSFRRDRRIWLHFSS